MTTRPTAPASTKLSMRGWTSMPASASSKAPSATTPPRCATSSPNSTSNPSPGPFPTHSRPWTPTRATAASATNGTRTWPSQKPASSIPTRSRATPPHRRHARAPRPAPSRPNARQALDTLLLDYTPHPAGPDRTSTLSQRTARRLPRGPEPQGHRRKTLSTLWTSVLRTSRATKNGRNALRLADAGEAMLADRNRYSIHLEDHPDDAQRIRASSHSSTPPSGETTPPSVANEVKTSLNLKRTPNASPLAAASSPSARRNWHPAILDGLPGPP